MESDGLPLRAHSIIVGNSGSGKSNTVISLIIRKIRDEQHFHIIDTKYELGPIFKRTKNVWITKPEHAEAKFDELIAMAKMRQVMFEQASELCKCKVSDYGDYYKVTGLKMPVITLIVEELLITMAYVNETKLNELLSAGRSAGIFVTCCAQYLNAKVLGKYGTVNFNTRVYLGRYDDVAFRVLFGNLDKVKLDEFKNYVGAPGKAITEIDGQFGMKQMPRITEAQLQEYFQ